MLAKIQLAGILCGLIHPATSSKIPSRNPYRAILRRDFPEPFIALLAFVMGIWLWDHYFGKSEGYAPGTEEIALIKIDRDLRLADAMAEDPKWLAWLAGVDSPATATNHALADLHQLTVEKAISFQGLEAYAILKASHTGTPIRQVLAEVLQGQTVSDFTDVSNRLASHRGTWWQAKWIDSLEQDMRPACQWRQVYGQDSHQLRTRAIIARSMVWLISLVGLVFLPGTLRTLKQGLHAKPRGYASAWSLPLGLTVFLVATLAWIGFTMALEIGIESLPNLHPAFAIALDSAARLLPSLIAIGLLFRRPSHAIRALGLDRPICPKTIFGMFALLTLIDQLLRLTLMKDGSGEPGGGLSAAEAGWWGLTFSIISACLLAPLAEEFLYRGILFRSLWNRLGVIAAMVLSSAIFAVLHFYDGYGLASVAVFGLSCAMLYAATGSLGSTIVLHMLYNSAIKLPEWWIYHAPLG
jgi:membrane protease YdiL (CAAX protease family)